MKKFCFLLFMSIFLITCKNNNTKVLENKNDTIATSKKVESIEERKENQESYKCDIKRIVALRNNIENATNKQIEEFLLTFDESCNMNVEYLEFSNEVLFSILYTKPKETLMILSNNDDIKKNIIITQLSMPVSDKINIQQLIEIIKSVDKVPMKEEILNALDRVPN